MAEEVKVFSNTIDTNGLRIIVAKPVDDRVIVVDEASVIDAFTPPYTAGENEFTATLYDAIVIKSKLTGNEYVWKESEFGLLPTSFTYPPFDYEYGDKNYNFIRYDNIVKLDMQYSDTNVAGFLIPNSVLSYHVLKDKTNSQVVFKSSVTSFKEIEFPNYVEETAEGILISITPAPTVGEQFKITIS